MSALFNPPKPPPPVIIPPPRVPQTDDAASARNKEDAQRIRSAGGRASTLLAGTRGLSDLGTVGSPTATNGGAP